MDKLIKMYISPSGGTATVDCAMHSEQQLLKAGYTAGYFVTKEQLKEALTLMDIDNCNHRPSVEKVLKELGVE